MGNIKPAGLEAEPLFVIDEVTERLTDHDGQLLLIPDLEVPSWWTNLSECGEGCIKLPAASPSLRIRAPSAFSEAAQELHAPRHSYSTRQRPPLAGPSRLTRPLPFNWASLRSTVRADTPSTWATRFALMLGCWRRRRRIFSDNFSAMSEKMTESCGRGPVLRIAQKGIDLFS